MLFAGDGACVRPTGFRGLAALFVILGLVLWTGIAYAQAPKRVALVIGNGNYQNVMPLTNPANDARLIASALRKVNFEVEEKYDLNYHDMRDALVAFADRTTGAEAAVIYFAGHGLADTAGNNFLVPVDAYLRRSTDLELQTVSATALVAAVDGAKTLKLVILDACRDDPFLPGIAGGNWAKGLNVNIEIQGARAIVTSASAEQLALDSADKNSPFAKALAEDLPKQGLEVRELFANVVADVERETGNAQKPHLYRSIDAPPFVFVPSPGLAPRALLPATAPAAENGTLARPEFQPASPGNTLGTVPQAAVDAIRTRVDPDSPSQGGTQVVPIDSLPLNTDVASAIQAAREAEADAREKAASGRAAQAWASQAAAQARIAAQGAATPPQSQPRNDNLTEQSFPGLGTYQGGIAGGVRQGVGVWADASGERYEGEWSGDNRNGVGVTTPPGATEPRYEGTWQDGSPCGLGVLTWPNGDRYEGEYCKGHYSGVGVFYFSTTSNTNYARENAGQWAVDKQTGFGVRVWAGGNRSEGSWQDGELTGYGAEFDTSGQVSTKLNVMQQGYFQNNRLVTPLSP